MSAVEICNLAISRVGGEIIDDLNENTPLGAYCLTTYDHKIGWLLSKYRWDFCKKIVLLAQVSLGADTVSQPAPNAFVPPSDLIGVIHVFRNQASVEGAYPVDVFQSDGKYWSSQAPIWVEYTAKKPENEWPMWFRELAIVAYAADIARFLQMRTLASELEQTAFGTPSERGEGGLYSTARNEDARSAPPRQMYGFDDGPLIGVRYNGAPFTGFTIRN